MVGKAQLRASWPLCPDSFPIQISQLAMEEKEIHTLVVLVKCYSQLVRRVKDLSQATEEVEGCLPQEEVGLEGPPYLVEEEVEE